MATRVARAMTVLAVALGGTAVVAGGGVASAQPYFDVDAVYRVPLDAAPARGPADAPVTIVEFSDFQCRFCVKSQATLTDLSRLYPGKLRFVYRHNPLDPEDGTLAAEASLAAQEQGQFWAMHHRLYANPVRVTRAAVDSYARELGLDMIRFRTALDQRRLRAAVLKDAELAHKLGARSTPMFFINGRAVKGAQPLSVFATVVDQELARVAELRARSGPSAATYARLVAGGLSRAGVGTGTDPVYPVAKVVPSSLYRLLPALPGHSRGPADAAVTIVEFSDFECVYCATEAPRLRALEKRFPGLIRFEYRHLPLSFHANAELAAEAAVEAGVQGKFWVLHDLLFGVGGALPRAVLEKRALAAGLDMPRFRGALDSHRHRPQVASRAASVRALGIRGTPTMFINGTPVAGAVPLQKLVEIVLAKKAAAEAMIASGVEPGKVAATALRDANVVERAPSPSAPPVPPAPPAPSAP